MDRILPLLLSWCLLVSAASAQYWTDDFTAYTPGTLCPGTGCANAGVSGGWDAWDANSANAGIIQSTYSHSGPYALSVTNAQDEIYPFILNDPMGFPQTGAWRLTLWQYLDSATFTAGTQLQYVILNNAYAHLGPYQWCLQLVADPSTMLVRDIDRVSTQQPVVLDQWVMIRIDMNLDTDCMVTWYNGAQVSSGTFQVTASYGGPPVQLANLDLYSPAGTGYAYYDDITLQQIAGTGYQVNSPAASLDIDGIQGFGCAPAITVKGQGVSSTLHYSSNLTYPYDVALVVGPAVPPGAGGLLTPGGQSVNIDITSPSLLWLNSGGSLPNLQGFPSAPQSLTFITPMNPLNATAQMIIINPATPIDSFTLSQAAQLQVN